MVTRICDQFKSVQGEGKRTGIPCIFIRSFGCNLPGCPGFGQKDPCDPSTWEQPEYSLNTSPKFGCDSPNSWHSKFRDLFPAYNTGEEYYNHLRTQYKYKDFNEIVITGGEPLLHQTFWLEFFTAMKNDMKSGMFLDDSTKHITFETNGIIPINDELKAFIDKQTKRGRFSFLLSISPKLNCVAGVDENKSINLETLKSHFIGRQKYLWDVQLKFVFNGSEKAQSRVLEIYQSLVKANIGIESTDIQLMPVGGFNVEQNIKVMTAEACLKEGFRYCERVHVDIWGSKMGV